MNPPDLPGYRYDHDLKRYFKIESIRSRENSASLTSSQHQPNLANNTSSRPKKRANIDVIRDPIRLLQRACRHAIVDPEAIGPELPIANLCAYQNEDQRFVVGSCGDGSLICMDSNNTTEYSQLIPSGGVLSENTPEAIALEEARKSILVWHPKRPLLLSITTANDNQKLVDIFNFESEPEQLDPISLNSQVNCAAWMGDTSLVAFGNKNQRGALVSINAEEPIAWLPQLPSDALCCTAVDNNLAYIGLRSGQFAFTDTRQVSIIQSHAKFNAPIESLQMFSATGDHGNLIAHAPAGMGKPSTFLLDFRMLGERGPLLTFDLQSRPGNTKPVLTCLDHDDQQMLLVRDIRHQGLRFLECNFGSMCAEITGELPSSILSCLPLIVGPKVEILLGTGKGLSLCRTQQPNEIDQTSFA